MSKYYRSAFDLEAKPFRTGIVFPDDGKTQQQFKDEADINTIVKRFGLTGKLPTNFRTPSYGDFTGVGDYREALHAVLEAELEFMKLPADLRARFHNDPQQLLEFVGNEANREQAIEWGLIAKPAVPAVVAPATEPGK